MASRPSVFPDFAMDDVTDPSSGQPNVVEPSASKKSAGWVYNEKPPRQYFNWMQRLNSLWARYFDDKVTTLNTNTNGMDVLFKIASLQTYISTTKVSLFIFKSLIINPAGATPAQRKYVRLLWTGVDALDAPASVIGVPVTFSSSPGFSEFFPAITGDKRVVPIINNDGVLGSLKIENVDGSNGGLTYTYASPVSRLDGGVVEYYPGPVGD